MHLKLSLGLIKHSRRRIFHIYLQSHRQDIDGTIVADVCGVVVDSWGVVADTGYLLRSCGWWSCPLASLSTHTAASSTSTFNLTDKAQSWLTHGELRLAYVELWLTQGESWLMYEKLWLMLAEKLGCCGRYMCSPLRRV